MMKQLIQIANIFAQVAIEEDSLLSRISQKGIFFMPELAYAYACGKAVMLNAQHLFGGRQVTWLREEDIGSGGPSDLVFKLEDGYRIVVEFKMRDKLTKYMNDIDKLKRLESPQDARIFCLLLDPFTDQLPDPRIEQIESTADCKMFPLLDPFPYFPTRQDWYQKEVSCLVAVWSVGEPPTM